MKLDHAVVFVTGANRGLGLSFVRALQARGVRKIYAGVRNPAGFDIPGVIPVQLDVTRADQVAAAAAQCADTTVLINNAGIAQLTNFLDTDVEEVARAIFETNFYGLIKTSHAFAPVLAANGGGAIVNVLSIASWISTQGLGAYAASKSAAWSFTNGLRTELAAQGTHVAALHVGFMDTDLTKDLDMPKVSPDDVAQQTLVDLEAGLDEILADDVTRMVKQGLSANPGVYLAPIER